MERKKSFVSSLQEGVRRAQEGNFAFIGEAVSLDLAASRSCKLTRSEEVIGTRGYSIAAPLGESESRGEGRCNGRCHHWMSLFCLLKFPILAVSYRTASLATHCSAVVCDSFGRVI